MAGRKAKGDSRCREIWIWNLDRTRNTELRYWVDFQWSRVEWEHERQMTWHVTDAGRWRRETQDIGKWERGAETGDIYHSEVEIPSRDFSMRREDE